MLVVPADDVPWYCGQCELRLATAAAETNAAEDGAARRSARTARSAPTSYVGNYKGRNLGGSDRGSNRQQLVHTNPSGSASASNDKTTTTTTKKKKAKRNT